jgi:hypothetical protein
MTRIWLMDQGPATCSMKDVGAHSREAQLAVLVLLVPGWPCHRQRSVEVLPTSEPILPRHNTTEGCQPNTAMWLGWLCNAWEDL